MTMSCKKIKSSAVVGESLALSFAIVNPATENTLSEGAAKLLEYTKFFCKTGKIGKPELVVPPPCQQISEAVIRIVHA